MAELGDALIKAKKLLEKIADQVIFDDNHKCVRCADLAPSSKTGMLTYLYRKKNLAADDLLKVNDSVTLAVENPDGTMANFMTIEYDTFVAYTFNDEIFLVINCDMTPNKDLTVNNTIGFMSANDQLLAEVRFSGGGRYLDETRVILRTECGDVYSYSAAKKKWFFHDNVKNIVGTLAEYNIAVQLSVAGDGDDSKPLTNEKFIKKDDITIRWGAQGKKSNIITVTYKNNVLFTINKSFFIQYRAAGKVVDQSFLHFRLAE